MSGPIIILGAAGMLGTTFRRHAEMWDSRGERVRFLTRRECDLRDPVAVRAAVAPGAGVVINCAGWTDVDKAESDEAAATVVNGEAVGRLAERCQQVGAALVHFSTDYVFDGAATRPYPVDHPIRPINAYGRSKAEGEGQIASAFPAGGRFLIIRTSWLYAPHGRNFVLTIARMARERASIRVVNDQRGRPTSCDTLAAATQRLMEADARGVFHACDGGECTWFDLACAVAARANPSCRVDPCASAEFPRPARRPAYSVLDLSLTERIAGSPPDWRTSLDHVLTAALSSAPQPA